MSDTETQPKPRPPGDAPQSGSPPLDPLAAGSPPRDAPPADAPSAESRSHEPLPPVEPPSAGFLVQLFLIPGLIVAIIVLVWGLFNWVANSGGDDPQKIVQNLRGPTPLAWRNAMTLAEMLNGDRDRKYVGDPKLAADLAQILDDRLAAGGTDRYSVELRAYLCGALGYFTTPEGLPALLKAATTNHGNEDLPVRWTAIESIANLALQAPKAVAASPANGEMRDTIMELSHDPEASIRLRAAYALGILGGPRELDRLNAMMLGDQDRAVSYNAATGLARQGDARSSDTLLDMLSYDPPPTAEELKRSPEERAAQRRLTITAALEAIAQLAKTNRSDDLSRLQTAVDKLQSNADILTRGEAKNASDALRARPHPAESPSAK